MKIFFLFLIPVFLLSGCIAVEEKLYLGPDCVLLDVRSEKEYNEGHIPKALHIPHTKVEVEVPRRFPGKETPIFIYCRSGKRAGIALEKLKKLSYKNVFNLGGKKEAEKLLLP